MSTKLLNQKKNNVNRNKDIVNRLVGRCGYSRQTVREVAKTKNLSFQRIAQIYQTYKKQYEPTLPELRVLWALKEAERNSN